ncbi:hypothetical protein DPM33_12765 [Mesorhizobium hawassense]|uniref:Uncharacterized protein n=1 Tax=Mesorhizobium hawassense TaxID=1209954 RepID=A0A330HNW0_9HYPH|nr:hypothetical protein [Mesorhizobium hawassense]RAZ90396.1 hypothetical protein DPM33_12765 [Mesorhizobium hawassense]
MRKLLALCVLAIVAFTSFWVLAIVEIASLFWDYRETASMARNRGSGAPPPMLDEPDGVPTHAAPSENGTNRAYAVDESAAALTSANWQGRPLTR